MAERKTVFVTGANGMIGNAVCRAFVRAGWKTYGLVRRQSSFQSLMAEEITPLLGSSSDHSFINSLHAETKKIDVICSVTEDFVDYAKHFNELLTLFQTLAEASNENGVRPLVLFTSGCKDYGTTALHGDPGLAPHTESSPLNPPKILRARTENSLRIFDFHDQFDAAIIRPTTIYGRSGSYYAAAFQYAEEAMKKGVLEYSASPNSILHGTHVDDCAEAYLALATHSPRSDIASQCFNVSGRRYETLSQVAQALVKEYGIKGGVKFRQFQEGDDPRMNDYLVNFSQWVGSEKIRNLSGWTDKKPLFTEGISVYRKAYEALSAQGHEGIERVKQVEAFVEREKTKEST